MTSLLNPLKSIFRLRKRKKPFKRNQPKGIRGYLKRALKTSLWLVATLFMALILLITTLRFVDPPTWAWKIHRQMNPPKGYPSVISHQWRDIEQIPLSIQLAVVASEDQKFPFHHGLDLTAIQQALSEAEDGKALRGASTITQQTVKNLFLWPQKAWSRKFLEAGLALLVDLLWDKQRVLEVYLNIAEFGPGVYGVEAASDYWYHRRLDRLTANQAARLAAILPNPWRYRAEPPTAYIVERSAWIEAQMGRLGYEWLEGL